MRMSRCIPVLLAGLTHAACGPSVPARTAVPVPGIVTVDIEEGGTPEHYRVYKVEASRAAVELTKQEVISDPYHSDIPPHMQQKSGTFYYCEKAPPGNSPDQTAVANCSAIHGIDDLRISDLSGKDIAHWTKKGRDIRGFAWSPDSKSIAVLNISRRLEWSFTEILAIFSGHSYTHDAVYLDFVELSSGKVTEYVVWSDVISSFPRILEWD